MLPKKEQTGDKSNNDIVNVIEENERGATGGLRVVKHTGTLAKGCYQSYSLNPPILDSSVFHCHICFNVI